MLAAKVFIVVVSITFATPFIEDDANLVAILVAYIAHAFISVLEVTVDTLFICYSEDCEQSNGNVKPCLMSPELKDVMLKVKDEDKKGFAWPSWPNLKEMIFKPQTTCAVVVQQQYVYQASCTHFPVLVQNPAETAVACNKK